jgi:hypothetical protein
MGLADMVMSFGDSDGGGGGGGGAGVENLYSKILTD